MFGFGAQKTLKLELYKLIKLDCLFFIDNNQLVIFSFVFCCVMVIVYNGGVNGFYE